MRKKYFYEGRAYDNMSLDGKCYFLEEGHQYIIPSKNEKLASVTHTIENFHEEFVSPDVAAKCSNSEKSEYYGREVDSIVKEWDDNTKLSSDLHAYAESLLNVAYAIDNKVLDKPDSPKVKWIPEIIEYWKKNGYVLAMTELLMYAPHLLLAGQADMMFKKRGKFQIYDWKFLKKPIQKRSHFNYKTRKYKKMEGPFKYLMDCNWIHYSIQLAMYETLTGAPELVDEKVLVVVNDKGWEFVPAYPMKVGWTEDNELFAIYEIHNGLFYDSRIGRLTKRKLL